MPLTDFVVRAGSVTGRLHRGLDRPNQDAMYLHRWDGGLVAVVCDGCGSAPASGVGAALGARLVAGAVARHQLLLANASSKPEVQSFLDATAEDVLAALRALVGQCAGPAAWTIADTLLFTVLGLAVVGEQAVIFGLGDGIWGVNGAVETLGPYPGNAPPYLAYALLPEMQASVAFHCHAFMPVSDLRVAVIGTDGMAGALTDTERPLPGTTELFGPLAQFWEDDCYLEHADLLRRRLARAARAVLGAQAIFADDATLIVARRAP